MQQQQAGFNLISNQNLFQQQESSILIVQTIGAYTKKDSSRRKQQQQKLQKPIKLEQDNIQEYVKQEYSQSSTASLNHYIINQQYHQESDHSSRTGETCNREDLKTQSQKSKKPSQSQVKNANKFYYKKFLTHLLAKKPESGVISNTEFSDLLDRIKKSGNRDNYTLKHFRVVCLKLNEKNIEKLSEQDRVCHDFIFGDLWKNQQYDLINKIKTTISALILEFIEANQQIQKDIRMKWAEQPELIDRYSNWSVHLSINIRKMLQGQYVSRF